MLLKWNKFYLYTHSKLKTLYAIHLELIININFYFKVTVYLYIAMPFINGGDMFIHFNMTNFDEMLE
jgi:hypothetical protein